VRGALPEAPIERIRRHLVGLRMPRALETLDQLVEQLERGQLSAIEAIEVLLAEELTVRESRRVKAALQMARLTPIKTLSGFDFSFQPSLDPFADILDSLAKAEREGRLRERIRFFCRTSLMIIDEIGYLTVGAGAGNLFFQLVNARYERGAMILTSNRGFSEWGEVFGGPVVATALLDRLLHHAVVVHIEGASYRLREHADLVPEALRPKPMAVPVAEQRHSRARSAKRHDGKAS
jgi:DNA replication protein DnaC